MDPDNIDDLPAGSEVPDDLMDDDERDTAALAAESGEPTQPRTREEIMAEMQAAMGVQPEGDAAPAPAPKDDKAPKADDKPAGQEQPKEGDKPKEGDTPPAPAAKPQTDEEKAKAEEDRKAAVDQEADALKLKGKSRERFHELSRTVSEQSEQLKAYQELSADPVKLKEEVGQLVAFQDAIFESGLDGTDFKNVAGYKKAITGDDPAAWEAARAFLLQELEWLETERMGIRTKDGADPYTVHEDLAAEVASGEISVKRANEIAATRNVKKTASVVRTQTAEQRQAQEVAEQATNACAEFATSANRADPAEWAAKWPTLQPKLAQIQKDYPPKDWADRMELEYRRIPYARQQAPAAAAGAPAQAPVRQARPGVLPRSGGARRPAGVEVGAMQVDKSRQSAFDALMSGLNGDEG